MTCIYNLVLVYNLRVAASIIFPYSRCILDPVPDILGDRRDASVLPGDIRWPVHEGGWY